MIETRRLYQKSGELVSGMRLSLVVCGVFKPYDSNLSTIYCLLMFIIYVLYIF